MGSLKSKVIFCVGILILQGALYYLLDFGIVYVLLSVLGTYLVAFVSNFLDRGMDQEKPSHLLDMEGNETTTINKKIIGELLDISETMNFDIQQLLWLSSNNSKAFEKLASLFYKIQENGEQNAASAEEITATMEDFVQSSDDMNSIIIKTEGESNKSYHMLAENKNTLDSIQTSMLGLAKSIQETSKNHEELYKSSQEIDKIIEYIQGISKQINLLSLNASIEAARAGEAGRGFSIVAQEIKKLSEETNKATEKIEKVVRTIYKGMDITQNSIGKMVEEVQHTETIAKETSLVVSDIEGIINNIKESLEKVKSISNKQLIASKEVNQESHSAAVAVEETHGMLYDLMKIVETQQNKNAEMIDYGNKLGEVSERFQENIVKVKGENEVLIGVNPFTAPENIKNMYAPILSKVCREIGCEARTIIVKNYQTLSDWIGQGKIDIGWFSPFAYVKAKEKSNIMPLVTPVVKGKDSYQGYIIAKKNKGIHGIGDLKNRSFGYVDKNSASGYLFAKDLMAKNNIKDENLSKVVFLGSHDKVIQGVLSGEVEAGATYSEAFDLAVAQGLPMEEIEIITKTDPIPKDAIAARENLSQTLMEQLKEAFIGYVKDEAFQTPVEGFVESKDSNYNIIRSINHSL